MKPASLQRVRYGVALALGATILGCGEHDDEGTVQKLSLAPPVSWETFRASVYREPWEGGHFVVDGDVPLSDEAELRDYYDSWSPPGALTVSQVFGSGVDNLWSSSAKLNLTYCIGSSTGANKSLVQAAMAAATASWSDIVAVRFTYLPGQDATCTSTNTNVTFDVQQVAEDGIFAISFFPDDSRGSRRLLLRPSAYTATAGGRDFQGIVRHELGHVLGFRHEHIWLTNGCTGEHLTEDGLDARLVTAYDVNSVMHYPQCRPSMTGGYRQSLDDYRGGVSLYGLSAQLINSAVLGTTALLQ